MKKFIRLTIDFWTTYVPLAWEKEPLDNKLSWLVFGVYTFALVTIIELFLLKR